MYFRGQTSMKIYTPEKETMFKQTTEIIQQLDKAYTFPKW